MSVPPADDTAADDGLPPWLRELQGGQAPSMGYGQPPAAPYGSPNMPGAGGYGGYRQSPPQGIPWPQPQPQPQPGYAGSPQGYGQTGYMPPDYGQAQQGYGQPPRSMQASDLVSADALPEWLRNAASGPLQGPNGNSGAGGSPAQPGYPGYPGYGQPGAPSAGTRYPPNAPNAGNSVGPLGSGQLGYGQPASTLFDESALPDWLRQASMGHEIEADLPARQQPPSASPAYPGYGMPGGPAAYEAGGAGYNNQRAPESIQRNQPVAQAPGGALASAFPSLDQAGAYRVASPAEMGITGHSLLDPNALPAWLGGQPGAPASSANRTPANSGGMPAQSLVDESALPQWLRAEPNTPAAPAAPSAMSYGTPASPGSPSALAAQGESGWLAPPISAEPLPEWLSQAYADANVPRAEPRSVGMPGYGAGGYGMPSGNGVPNFSGGTVSASEFVDESALPDWLKSQGAVENAREAAAPPAYSPPAPAPTPMRPVSTGLPDGTVPEHRVAPMYRPTSETSDAPQGQFAASDLIDPSALPSWVTAQHPAPEPSFSSATGWTTKQPAASPMRPETDRDYGEATARGGGTGDLRRAGPGGSRWLNEGDEDPRQGRGRYPQQPPRPSTAYGDEDSRGYGGGYGRMPGMPNPDGRAGGNSMGRRRGPPIPSEDLPPWLHGTGPDSTRGGGAAYGEQEAAPQWDDWDDDAYGGGDGYARQDEYAQDDDDAELPQDRHGGWRRFFGRK